MRKFVAAYMISAFAGAAFAAQPAPTPVQSVAPSPFDSAAAAKSVLVPLASTLRENYVDPATAGRYSAALKSRLAAGAYDHLASSDELAKAVTSDLQAVSGDAHLRLFSPQMMEKLKSGPRGSSPGKRPDSFIDKSGWVAPGVAYISFLAFMGDKPTLAQLRAFLASHSDAKVLIIDARRHHGGGMEEMDLIFSQLFGEPVDLLDLDTREAADARDGFDFGDLPTIRKVAAPAGVVRRVHSVIPAAAKAALRTAKVFVLTSSRTASAGEHFALALKSTGRATIVGETTRGAGNYGRHFDLPGGYSAFIPTGRTFDPKTGKGWEGVGVAPDVAVPADKALDEALKLAGVQVSGEAALAALH